MRSNEYKHSKFDELRKKAEKIVDAHKVSPDDITDINHLVHELEVHQVELETQYEELLETQEELKTLKTRYQELFEQAPAGYFLLDEHTFIQDLNYTGIQLLDSSKKHIIGSALNRYVTSAYRHVIYAHFQELFTDGTRQKCELQLLRSGGEDDTGRFVILESSFISGTADNNRSILSTMTDISELKQKEQELARSRQEYTTIVEMANSIIAEIDTEGRITFINQTGLETLGFSREELIGKPALGTFIPEQESTGRDLSTLLTDIIQNHRSHIITEHENLRSDGSRMWIHWQNRAMTDSKGRVTGILGVGQDITERKKAEEVLQRDKQTLESLVQERTTKLMAAQQELERSRRLADLGRLSSSIAHELRRPLAAIKLSLYNIRKKRKNDAIDTHLDHCEGKIAEGEQIINNILHSSSLKQPQVEEIDLATLLIECIEYAESHYIDKTTTIHRKLEPLRSTKVEADPHQMREVMLNILQNACEAVFDEPANIAVQGFAREDTIGFSVSDTNDGIPEGELAKVTEPFYSTKHRGMGLGLTIAQEIVTLHNGTLEVDSSPGAGTTVTVTLPKSTGY